jgi:hypothetical protein
MKRCTLMAVAPYQGYMFAWNFEALFTSTASLLARQLDPHNQKLAALMVPQVEPAFLGTFLPFPIKCEDDTRAIACLCNFSALSKMSQPNAGTFLHSKS